MQHRVHILVVSDVHLGSAYSNAAKLLKVLQDYDYDLLVIVGDLYEDGPLDKTHWELITYLRENKHRIIYVDGNHDPAAENLLSNVIGVPVAEKHELTIGGKKFCFLHGHQFDKLSFLFGPAWLDRMFNWSMRLAKKCWLIGNVVARLHHRLSLRLARKAIQYATNHGYDRIVCGHIHAPLQLTQDGIEYYNCGGWIEELETFLTITEEGVTQIHNVA